MARLQTDLERAMAGSIRLNKLPEPQVEYPFAQSLKRRWRFDFAYPEAKVALEVEGGTWTNGRHSRGKGFEGDVDKANMAQLLGWLVIRVTTDMVYDNRAADVLRAALILRGGL